MDTGAKCTLVHGSPLKFSGSQHHQWSKRTNICQEDPFDTTNWAISSIRIQGFYFFNAREYIGHRYPSARSKSANLNRWILPPGYSNQTSAEEKNQPKIRRSTTPLKNAKFQTIFMSNNCYIAWGTQGNRKTIQELHQVGIVGSALNAFNSQVWPVKKSDGSWRMIIGSQRLINVVPVLHPYGCAQHCRSLGHNPRNVPWYGWLANAFFSIPLATESQDQFCLHVGGAKWTIQVFPQDYLHGSTVCYQMVMGDLSLFSFLMSMKWAHCIDEI